MAVAPTSLDPFTSDLMGLDPPDAVRYSVRGLEDADMLVITHSLIKAGAGFLRTINLSMNLISDGGAVALSRVLQSAPGLNQLLLHENRIGNEGLEALARAMHAGAASQISELRLSFNRIGDSGAASIARAWGQGGGCNLKQLHLACNLIGDAGAVAIANALHNAPKIEVLSFGSARGGNRVNDAGARALAGAVCAHVQSSMALHLKLNPISAVVLMEVDAAMSARKPLISFE
uniref:Uncharacterized protein n=1 Tax=Haptolina ericina TaxID=156174 RepID=A0A7S3EX48_9EUKA